MNATPERKPLIFHSNAAWAQTGYGCQTAMFVPRIADLGYDVAISAFWGLGAACIAIVIASVFLAGHLFTAWSRPGPAAPSLPPRARVGIVEQTLIESTERGLDATLD